MKLHTMQLAQHRAVRAAGIPIFDTTAKSGGTGNIFSPSWTMVSRHKSGLMTDQEYVDEYTARMRNSYKTRTEEWLKFLRQPEVAIACYCPPGKFCHRHLLKDILIKVATHHGIPFEYAGEFIPVKKQEESKEITSDNGIRLVG